MTPALQKNLSVLVGNGLSIAFNPELSLDVLTRDVTERIKREYSNSGEEIALAMQKIGDRDPSGDPRRDFEVLIGAFGGQSRILDDLHHYAELADKDNLELQDAIETVREFAEKVRDHGISHVLELIAERSVAHYDLADGLHGFVDEVVGRFAGRITFANLNYDALLLSALLSSYQSILCDMGDPRGSWTLTAGGIEHPIGKLRGSLGDFPNRRLRLVHLHGSLTFWRSPKKGDFKFGTALLRNVNLWEKIRNGKTVMRPLVVLANQHDKSGEVTEMPYKLAYEAYAESLDASDHWLIVGYSFRDDCVNAVLRDAWARRKTRAKVLVVTLGDEPTREHVEMQLGWGEIEGDSRDWLFFERGGADELADPFGDWSTYFTRAEADAA